MDYGFEPLNSLSIIGTPLFFFVSGAVFRMGRPKSIWTIFKNRFKRLLLPWYIYAIISLVVLMGLSMRNSSYSLTSYSISDVLQIVFTLTIPRSPMMWHNWFIIPYLIVACAWGLQVKLINKFNIRGGYLLINILALAALWFLKFDGIWRTALCYNIFTVIGYLYYKQISYRNIGICLVVALSLLFLLLWVTGEPFFPMQGHKFPPDLIFVLYNVVVLCLFSMIFGHIKLKSNWLIDLWNERGYTIYLYQNFVIWAMFVLKCHFLMILPIYAQWIFCFVFALVVSTALSYLTYPLERKVMKWIHAI
jgi:fucose 4-O-acetylase-like acetyltransferase